VSEPAPPAGAPADLIRPADLVRPADGLSLLGEYQGSGFTEPRFLVRRGDGQVIQLSRLLYLVTAAIAEGSAAGGWDAAQVAARAGAEFGRELTADNIRYLVAGKLLPLGVVVPGRAGQPPDETPAAVPAPRSDLLLGLKIRGVLLRPRAAGAVGQALAWLHYPVLAGVLLAAFAALEVWLFAVHGVIGPVLLVLRDPVLFLAVAGLTLVSLLFHEFGHASACRYGGGRPGVIGFGLYLIFPSLYTDVTDVYRLSRATRLRVDLGGVYFNAIFILILAGGYAATGNPVFLAAVFLDNFQILQQLFPLVRMDGYFILGDLAGVPDLLGLLGAIMASVLPGARARRAGARARGLRRGPRVLVTCWVLVAIPLLLAMTGYTAWHLPAMISAVSQAFTSDLAAARAGFSAGDPAAGLVAAVNVALLVIPAAGLAYLLARVLARGGQRLLRTGLLRTQLLRTRPRRAAAALGTAGVLAAVAALTLAVAGTGNHRTGGSAATTAAGPARAVDSSAQAAAWVAQQVSPDVTVSCDPQLCRQLQRDGVPATRLKPLPVTAPDPLGSGVVVATPAIRSQFGSRLAADYAPQVIASFGSGATRVDVRTVAPDGAAAFTAQLAAERATLVSAGQQLLGNQNILPSPSARAQLRAGRVDFRLLATLSVLAHQMPVRLVAFNDAAPGSAGLPLRGAEISAAAPAARSAILGFLQAQRDPYRPVVSTTVTGLVVLRFDAPGLLSISPS
jgi:putative peptide zinc metalloprotease protein